MVNLKMFLLVLVSFLWSSTGFAQQAPRLSCTTSSETAIIDTSYTLTATDKGYRLYVQYDSGGIPIEADPTTTVRLRDVQRLKERAKLFSKVPEKFTFDFSKEQCHFRDQNSQLNWHCFTKEPGALGDLNYKSLSFFMYSEKSQSFYGVSQRYNVGFEFHLSYEEFIGRDQFKKRLAEANPDARKDLEFLRDHQSVLRSAVVTFENTTEHANCQVPEHQPLML